MAGYSEALEQSCSTKAGRLLLLQGCVFLATWHPHVCCHACPQGKGHGIHCEQRIATGAKGKGAKGKSKGKGLWQQPPDFSRFQLPNRTDLSSLRISEDSRERVFLNLQYAEAPVYGELYPLCLDLALPEGQGPFPCVVWCHGGRWLHGSHQGIVENAWGRFLRAQGWAVASVQYRFLQEAAWPACGTDLRRAVLELRQKAPELQLKADLMVAMGHSAGGHLVGLLPSHEPFLDGDRASAVAGIIGVAGAWMGPRNARHGDVRDLLGAEWPPLLALHGTEDELVEPEMSQELVAKLQELGVPAELVLLEGHGHNVLPAPPEAFKAVKRFLKSFTT